MQDLIEDYLNDVQTSKSQGTFEVRQRDLKRFDAFLDRQDLDVAEVGQRDIHRFFREQGQTYAHETMRSLWDTVKLLYDFLAGPWEEIEESPLDDLDRSKYTKGNGNGKHDAEGIVFATPEEIKQMCEHVPNPQLRNELIIRLFFHTGMRRGELVDVQMEDVTRFSKDDTVEADGGGSIRVYSDKVEDWRKVYWQPSLDFLMDSWIDEGYRDVYAQTDYLFPGQSSDHLAEEQVNTVVKRAAENAGIQEVLFEDAAGRNRYRITAHALRHGHAVQAIRNDIDIRRLQLHMGHEKLETTQKYLQFKDEAVHAAMSKFETRPEDSPSA